MRFISIVVLFLNIIIDINCNESISELYLINRNYSEISDEGYLKFFDKHVVYDLYNDAKSKVRGYGTFMVNSADSLITILHEEIPKNRYPLKSFFVKDHNNLLEKDQIQIVISDMDNKPIDTCNITFQGCDTELYSRKSRSKNNIVEINQSLLKKVNYIVVSSSHFIPIRIPYDGVTNKYYIIMSHFNKNKYCSSGSITLKYDFNGGKNLFIYVNDNRDYYTVLEQQEVSNEK
jgi:hypothetical protein